jgi:hypothetical protein
MLIGSVTVGGLFVHVVSPINSAMRRTGRSFFLWGMGLSAVAGLAYLGSLKGDIVSLLTGLAALDWP